MATAKMRLKRRLRKQPLPDTAAPFDLPPSTDDPGNWGPNEVLTAKIMPPPLENLRIRELITAEQYNAAKEIERVFHWVTAGLKCRNVDLNQIRGAAGAAADPLQAAYSTRYRPWAEALSNRRQPEPDAKDIARVLPSVGAAGMAKLAALVSGRSRPHTSAASLAIPAAPTLGSTRAMSFASGSG